MQRITPLLAVFIISLALSASAADALRGAAAILDQLAQGADQTKQPAKPPSEAAKLRTDVSNFTARVSALAPATAAGEWLALADRLAKMPARMRYGAGEEQVPPPQFPELIAALPPPAAWDELAKAIASRPAPKTLKDAREVSLRMLGLALSGDRAALGAQATAFDEMLLKAKREEAMSLLHVSRSINEALLAVSDDPKAILAGVERQLADSERGRDYGYSTLYLPDLVNIVGAATATPLIERALKSKVRDVTFQGKATETLARKLALQFIDDLKAPRWGLVTSLDAVELYEAFDKKFAKTNAPVQANAAEALADLEKEGYVDTHQKSTAQTYYLMGLIVRGRAADATKFARTLKEEDAAGDMQIAAGEAALSRAGFTRELDDFLHELLSQNPELPFWESYFAAAAQTGTTARMLTLARAAAAKPELTGLKRGNIRENLYRALLAADQVEEGVKELRALLATAPKSPAGVAGFRGRSTVRRIEWSQHALALARLGQLLEQPDLITEGLAAAMPKADDANAGDEFSATYQTRAVVETLVQAGRLGEAEKLLADQLAKSLKLSAAQGGYAGTSRTPSLEPLKSLVGLYHRAGRHEDVLLLLEKSPHWGAKDFAQLLSPSQGGMDFDMEEFGGGRFGKVAKSNPLAQAAAAALAQAGRKAEARAIVDALLDQTPNNDRAYELLIQLAGQEALPKLDALFARDQFEERPLIWKAHLLHQAGQEEEAEKVARQAIAIDPSDGEQGKNDRMRVYSILADIRAARFDVKEAGILRGAVRAIRLSERADDFYAAGLLSRAVKMYQESLTHFTDAYCIQSRLAVQLSALGQHDLAAKHYEKAFELMPDSFGRVESHCFGCEGAFTGTQAQGVAERVFTALATKTPNKPQVHYLLGYLRQQQGRGKDAIPHFRQALKLDPDYLNAWEHLEQLSQEHRLPAAERDNIAFNILRLDPLGRHANADLNTVSDLRRLWVAVETAAKSQIKPPTALLALPASREQIEKQESEAKNPRNRFGSNSYTEYRMNGQAANSPGVALARHQLLNAIASLASSAGNMGFEE